MAKIVWLASYPKSGNTWIRALLSNYLGDGATPADINQLRGGPIASSRLWFDEWSGVEASALDDAVIERLRPAVYRCLAREARDTLYMKVHDAWSIAPGGEPLFPADATAGVVYVVRNPLDLAASWAHHSGCDLERAAERLCDPVFETRGHASGLGEQLRQELGSWSGHVRSWTERSGLPCRVVRYEDLLGDPEGTFAGVVSFCGLTVDAARVARAVARSSFAELRRQEATAGFRERSVVASGPFFRRGLAGGWRSELSCALAQRLIDAHGETMRALGYLPAAVDGVDHGRMAS